MGLLIRSGQLAPAVLKEKVQLALSHGSRSQIFLSSMLRIPSILLADYEFTQIVARPTYMIIPELMPDRAIKHFNGKILRYPGIKEDVYVPGFKPDTTLRDRLKIGANELLIAIRPPATEAHYHNPESEKLFHATVNFLGQCHNTRMVILPRNEKKQTSIIKNTWPQLCDTGRIIIPDHVLDGLNLIFNSDLVISGGGTMNREAAALGVPVYSIFRGKIGAVDRYLSQNGRLTLIEKIEDIEQKIILTKRNPSVETEDTNGKVLNCIVDQIESIIKKQL